MKLRTQGLVKRFDATVALDRVDFDVRAGELHAIAGENGAGKSTLIKLLGGVYLPDAGSIALDGVTVRLHSPAAAFGRGIAVIQQELRIAPELTVAENVMLGHLPERGRWFRRVDWSKTRAIAKQSLGRLRVDLDPDAPIRSMSFAAKQSVVISRALSRDVQVLILDEPTAALDADESAALFAILQKLKDAGVAVIYVSHRLSEIVALADRCTVLRDGRQVVCLGRGMFSTGDLSRLMTGRDMTTSATPHPTLFGQIALEAEGVRLRAGEITGIAGLLGSGTGELLRRLAGAAAPVRIKVGGKPVAIASPRQARRAGLGFVPGERALGLVLDHTVRDNILLCRMAAAKPLGSIDGRVAEALVKELIEALDIRPADPDAMVRRLSGGNQQKVAIAKWLAVRIRVMLLDEPTQGVDVVAKGQIHRLIERFVAEGGSALFASTDSHELMSFADAVLPMRRHRIEGRLVRGPGLTEETLRDAIAG